MPHFSVRMQHSPPPYVLQQHSTSATFHPLIVNAAASGKGTRHWTPSISLAQPGSAIAGEALARIKMQAIVINVAIERSPTSLRLGRSYVCIVYP